MSKNDGRVDLRDVARLAGVSLGSASRAINGSGASAHVRSKVEQAAAALGYRPNHAAQALRSRASRTIGCLLPDMGSCLIAIDRATKENGCLQVIRGSHLLGRIDHGRTGDQTGADMERVNVALERLELVHVELEPGSAVLFHANLLHRSDQNHSENPRWALICCYNTRHNDPYMTGGRHPNYAPLEKWSDDHVRQALVG